MINDLKDLKALLKLCRSQGVTDIELGTIKLKFGDMPTENGSQVAYEQTEIESDNPYANFPSGILTPSQLAFYSSGGSPDDDPEIAVGE
jgi:hypothetical protein